MRLPEIRPARCARRSSLAVVAAGAVAGCAQQPAYQVNNQPVARAGTSNRSGRSTSRSTHPAPAPSAAASSAAASAVSIGGGSGKTAAMVVGAIGGGVVGNEMQKNQTD